MDDPILAYYQAIKDGTVCVGHWVRTWYKQIIDGLAKGSFFYDAKKAGRAIRFIENFCRHHEGALAPQHIKLELWQRALVAVLFGIVDATGARQFREALIVIARKNGKTLLAAAIAAYCAFLDGERGARVYFCAPKLEQSALCYDAFFQIVKGEPELNGRAKKRRTDIYIESTNSSARPLAFSSKKSDGLNISLAVADEIASWSGDQGLKFYEVLRSSFGARRQPLLLAISTAGYINEGPYDELMKRATAVLNGASKETRLAPFLYIIDDAEKWNDINELRKSNPNMGVSVSVDYLLDEIAIAEGSLPKRAEFLTKYCNIKQNSATAWLEFATVKKAMRDPVRPEDYRHTYAVAGIDLSQTTDLTSACVVIERGGVLNVISHFWLPAGRLEAGTAEDGVPYAAYIKRGILSLSGESFVDYNDIFRWLVGMIEKYEILPLCVGYDRYSAKYLIDQLDRYGFKTDDVYQGTNLTPVIKEFEGQIKDGRINIGDNSLLQAHLLNTALRHETESNRVRMVKVSSRARIDGAAALIDALTVRQKWYGEIGAQLANNRR